MAKLKTIVFQLVTLGILMTGSFAPRVTQAQVAAQPDAAKGASDACVNNLKMIGLSFRIWAGDHQNQLPFNVRTRKGGTKELCKPGADGFDANAFRHFQVMSNELSTPKILVCRGDSAAKPAATFGKLTAANVTYQLRSGTNINDAHPDEILARCPVHGHTLLCDGSVQAGGKR